MLFQGSADVGANEHFELVQRAGGTLNGSTWLDRTNYFETVPSNQLELALWLEANRMGYLLPAMTQQKLDTQRDVVQNERRWSVDNQPYGTWWEQLPALVLSAGPSIPSFAHRVDGRPRRGEPRRRRAVLRDLLHAGQRGAVHRRRLRSGRSAPDGRAPLRPDSARDGKAAAARHVAAADASAQWMREVVPDDVMLPRLFLAFRSPAFGTRRVLRRERVRRDARPAKGSRLHRRSVRERQIAAEASAFTYDLAKGSDLLVVDVTARPGIDAEQLEQEVACGDRSARCATA